MLILAVGIGIVFCIIVFICYSYKQNKINGQNTHPKYTKYLKGNMGENQ